MHYKSRTRMNAHHHTYMHRWTIHLYIINNGRSCEDEMYNIKQEVIKCYYYLRIHSKTSVKFTSIHRRLLYELYININVRVCVCVCVRVYVSARASNLSHMQRYIYIYIVCTIVCMCVCTYMHTYVFMYAHIYIHFLPHILQNFYWR